ncbi:hypothetical protein AcW1_000445 [Taiwanofungus camphoratus]|nr:hypothetical protein AcV5_004344 [Antrodia cinnamomea]KAI0963342.1 hypothetical protein AcW1_000445 [Antrodia cinnamomea]
MCVMLDLALTQIGGPGAGGELFVLERGFAYHNALLCRYADDSGELKILGKLRLSPPDVRRQSDALVEMALARLAQIASGQDNFCQYCGRDGVDTRYSKCKKACFCRDCQALGWKYHKVWCLAA